MNVAKFHRIVSVAVIIAFVVTTTEVVGAQAPQQSATPAAGASQSAETTATGMNDGELLAGGTRTGGNLAAGLALGALTGLIGTGIGYFVIGPKDLTAEAIQRMSGKNADYQLGFKAGWEKKTESKKRRA